MCRWATIKLTLDKFKMDKPVTGLPEKRKRSHAYGAPSIDEFQAAITKHRTRSKAGKRRSSAPTRDGR